MVLGTAAVAVPGAGAAVTPQTGPVIIGNGTIGLGVHPTGELNVGGGPTSSSGTTAYGLRYLPTGAEATAPGCLCEGWGAADAGSGLRGSANQDDGGPSNLVVQSFEADATRAVSTVLIPKDGGSTGLRVTQDYHPFAGSPNLYEDTVTLTNTTSATMTDVRYRRVMDWDIEPTAFNEYSTIAAAEPVPFGNVLFTSNDGFASADPLAGPSDLGATGLFENAGPRDHGALFDFGFGALAPGKSVVFNVYYGGAASRAGAVAAAAAAGAEIYSLGSPTSSAPGEGTPNTFVFAFSGVGGSGLSGSDPRPPVGLDVYDEASTSPLWTITAVLRNRSAADASGVSTTLTLPPGSPLALTSGTPTQTVGALAAGDDTSRSWTVRAPVSCTDQAYPYRVTSTYSGDGGDVRTVDALLQVPASTCASTPTVTTRNVELVSGQRFTGVLAEGTSGALPAVAKGGTSFKTFATRTLTSSTFVVDGSTVSFYAPTVTRTTVYPYYVTITDANGQTTTGRGTVTVLPRR